MSNAPHSPPVNETASDHPCAPDDHAGDTGTSGINAILHVDLGADANAGLCAPPGVLTGLEATVASSGAEAGDIAGKLLGAVFGTAGCDDAETSSPNGQSCETDAPGDQASLITVSALNGSGDSHILSASVGGIELGVGIGSGDSSAHSIARSAPGDGGDAVGSLLKLALKDGSGGIGTMFAGDGAHGGHAYDAHVPLAMGEGLLQGIGAALDALVSSDHLPDVPALDLAHLPVDFDHNG